MLKSNIESDIQFLPGVGPKRAAVLKKELNVNTIDDLIHIYPFRYIDKSRITPISEIASGVAYIQIKAKVLRTVIYGQGSRIIEIKDNKIDFRQAKRLSVIVSDNSGQMEMLFFRGIKYTFNRLSPGKTFIFFGKPSIFNGKINIVHPEVDEVSQAGNQQESSRNSENALTMAGVYTSTEGIKNAGITGRVMSRIMASALRIELDNVRETLPDYVLKDKDLVSLRYALQNIHFPTGTDALIKASKRLKFEELLLLQLALLKQKYISSREDTGIVMTKVGEGFSQCYNALPYELTGAQKRVIKEIRADLMSGKQMNRLLQGDVGSGKTMVAVLSSLIAIGNGCQACIMAPTEVLANQHYANILKYLKSTSIKTALLTGSTSKSERKEIHEGLQNGTIGLIVGTHALIEDDVIFKKLGLAVIDEQHRFGVEQRAKLWSKGDVPPHVLVMTATPIPRTLAMTLYGDLDVSVIDEMPPGRKPVHTMIITEHRRYAMNKFIKEQIAVGRQIFIVYPLIFESEKLDYKNLEQGYERIVEDFPLPKYKVAIVHGKQTNDEKNFNMSAFVAGRADILVSTTVIEVGVDVPNASVMVIESAERFGLSQLHQLRGRVGRGSENSYCILVKGDKVSKESQKRLELLCSTEDGFELAEEDMKMRGPGDLSGTQQSGLPITLNIASLAKDGLLLAEARDYAQKILKNDPLLKKPENSKLLKELSKDRYVIKDYSKIS